MSLTTTQQSKLVAYAVGMFGAAPGSANMSDLATAINAGMTEQNLVRAIAANSAFTALYPTYMTDADFATAFTTRLLGAQPATTDTTSKPSAADWTTAKTYIQGLITAAGTTVSQAQARADAMYTAINAVLGASNAAYADAQAAFANKVTVGVYYSVTAGLSSTDLATLQGVVSSVTKDAASVTAATAAIDSGATGTVGATYTLLTTADTVPGTGGNDTIIATDLTLSSADRINGAAGTGDELKLSAAVDKSYAAFELTNVETLTVTADAVSTQTMDLSGSAGLNLLRSLNSTGNVVLNQIPNVANAEINNVTTGANVTLSFQDTAVSGSTDTVNVALVNDYNNGVGTLQIGRTSAANAGIETVGIATSVANATITTLNTNLSTLNVTGNKNLTVTNALNVTLDTLAAGSFTGSLNVSLVGNVAATGEGALSIATGTGNDTINMLAVTRNATITMGDGNDTLVASQGDDTIDMGAGNDLMSFAALGITVNDTITGGAGVDTLRLTAADTISKSEAEKVTAVEVFDLRGAGGTILTVTDNLLNTISTGSTQFTVLTNSSTGGNTIDITNVTFSNTTKFALTAATGIVDANGVTTGLTATNDTVIANDATVNAKAVLAFGAGAGDTLKIVDGATITSDDMTNISGLENIFLQTTQNTAQVWNFQLTDALFRQASNANNDSTDNTVAIGPSNSLVALGAVLTLNVSDTVPAGSTINIDTSQLTAAQKLLIAANGLTINRNANIKVFVDGTEVPSGAAGGVVTVISSLQYTSNADTLTTMTGTAGVDTYVANFLNEVNLADSIDGLGGVDILQLNFAVANPAQTLLAQLNATSIVNVETLTFNSNDAVSYTTDGIASVVTVNFGSGNDTIVANSEVGTYNMGAGANSYTDTAAAAIGAESVSGLGGNDIFTFSGETTANGSQLTAADTVSGGLGTDTVTILDDAGGAGAIYALPTVGGLGVTNVLSGIEVINYTPGNVADGMSIVSVNTHTGDSSANPQFNITDGTGANTAVIFNAGAVVAGASNIVKVNVIGAGAGQAANVADVIGGADNDIITIGGTLTGYVAQGNAGADTINIATVNATGVLFASPNDGSATNSVAVYDTVTGFTSGTDFIVFALAPFAATNTVGTLTTATLVQKVNAPINAATSNVLIMTQAGSGFTNADLLSLSTVASRANTIGVTAAAATGFVIVAQGASQSGVYMYVEADGVANQVTANELKLLGVFDSNAVGNAAADMVYL